MLVAAISLALIRYIDTAEFSEYILVFTYFNIFFQLVSGIVERLYIVEHDAYSKNQTRYNLILAVSILLIPCIYIFATKDIQFLFLIVFLSCSSIFFQFKRIKLQKKEDFVGYASLEIKRNIIWSVIAFALIAYYREGFYKYILYSYGIINLIMLYPLAGSKAPTSESFATSIKYIFSKYYLILLSLLSGLFPYVVFLFISASNDKVLISSVGAAMRYQAILSMIVMSMNTIFLPKFASMFSHQDLLASKIWKQVTSALILSFVFILCIYQVIPIVDHGRYPDTPLYFVLISIPTLISLLGLPVVNRLLSNLKYKELFESLLLGLGAALVFYISAVTLDFDKTESLFYSMIVAYLVNFILNARKYYAFFKQ